MALTRLKTWLSEGWWMGLAVIVGLGSVTVALMALVRDGSETTTSSTRPRDSVLPTIANVTPPVSDEAAVPVIDGAYTASTMFWVVPEGADPAEPPVYGDRFGNVCDEWDEWARSVNAARLGSSLHGIELRLAARLDTPATLVSVAVDELERSPLGDARLAACTIGGGSSPAFQSPLPLDADPTVLEVSEFESNAAPVLVPPGALSIEPGLLETLVLFPAGEIGFRYSFRLRLELVIDGQQTDMVVGDGDEPFEFAFMQYGGPDSLDIAPDGPQTPTDPPESDDASGIEVERAAQPSASAGADEEVSYDGSQAQSSCGSVPLDFDALPDFNRVHRRACSGPWELVSFTHRLPELSVALFDQREPQNPVGVWRGVESGTNADYSADAIEAVGVPRDVAEDLFEELGGPSAGNQGPTAIDGVSVCTDNDNLGEFWRLTEHTAVEFCGPTHAFVRWPLIGEQSLTLVRIGEEDELGTVVETWSTGDINELGPEDLVARGVDGTEASALYTSMQCSYPEACDP